MPYKGADELESHEVDAATEGMTKITEKILKEFKDESERHIVILGAAMLEGLLMRLLQRSLVESPTENDTLFVGNGALATFSARSDMAFRLGLITKRFLDALNGIRKVRNDFAHEFDMSLDGPHEQRVLQLVSGLRETEAFQYMSKRFFDGATTTRTQLCTVMTILIVRLYGGVSRATRIKSGEPLDVLPQDWAKAKHIGEAVSRLAADVE